MMRIYINKVVKEWGIKPLCMIAAVMLATACSEANEEEDEYADWKNRNEAFFADIYANAQASTTGNWKLIRSFSKSTTAELPITDYIVVEVLETGDGTTSPIATDSVSVHYSGRLMPSKSYANGYEFDKTYSGIFDPDVSVPYAKQKVSGFIDGFATALQHMHRGDRWRVYIPYQLGYGSTSSSSIPSYSTTIFDMQLDDFWVKKRGDRP